MTNFNYDNYDDDTKAKYDDGIEFLDDDFSFDEDDDDDNIYDIPRYSDEPVAPHHHKEKQETIGQEILSYIKILAVAVIVAFLFTRFIIVNAQVPSGSMENTILTGDRLIGFRLAYLFHEPERGDIVIFKYPDDEKQNFVKRVIGIPGDVVQIIHGKVYVNGNELDEPYLREPMNDNEEEQVFVVPEGHYFVMGDNRNDSLDSRYWKTSNYVSEKKILAKVIFRYYNQSRHKINFKLFN